MSEQEISAHIGKRVKVKSRKLHAPVTGTLKALFGGALIIYSPVGIYGIFPHDVTELQEVLV